MKLRAFLNSSQFVGKGTTSNTATLSHRHGPGFAIRLEDVEATQLKTRRHSPKFFDMFNQFARQASGEFKLKQVTASD
jgi:hypothetical protein